MKFTSFKVCLTLKTPILSHSSSSIKFGVDATMLRDENGRPAFSRGLIKGNILEVLRDIENISGSDTLGINLDNFFGSRSNTDNNEPNRGKLHFSEYFSDLSYQAASQKKHIYRIAIDKDSGVVKKGALQIIESPYEANQSRKFTGYVSAYLTENEAEALEKNLNKALQIIPAIGANKGIGFGVIDRFCIKKIENSLDSKEPSQLDNNTEFGIRIKMQESFCFAEPALGKKNHFESKNYIPGSAIIASIMNRVCTGNYPNIKKNINKIKFNNAQAVPKSSKKIPIAAPLSLVKGDNENKSAYINLATNPQSKNYISYLIDWKDKEWDVVNKKFGIVSPVKTINIRTKIDHNKGIAKEGELFSMELVSPYFDQELAYEWITNVSLSEIENPTVRNGIIAELTQMFTTPHLDFGKTKAKAYLDIEEKFEPFVAQAENEGKVVVYLQSPARLLTTGFTCETTGAKEKIKEAYKKAWQAINKELEMTDYFAQQQIYGGEYWHRRFRDNTNYHPEILTTRGSVFIFEAKNRAALEALAKTGLPQIDDCAGGENFQKNPWINKNGFGEIMLDLNISSFGECDDE